MAWFRVDDKLHSAPKLLSIPRKYRLAALGLWSMAGSWSADHLTDGVIPDYMIEEWGGTKTLVEWLITAGLWEKVDGKTQFKNWAKYQPTKADVEEERRKNREKLQKWRDRNKVSDEGVTEGVTRLQTGSEPKDNPAPIPTQPDPPPTEAKASVKKHVGEAQIRDDFITWYAEYPLKKARAAAERAYIKARKTVDADTLMAGMIRYRDDPTRNPDFTKHPATWLNEGCWDDQPGRSTNPRFMPQQQRPSGSQLRLVAGYELLQQTRAEQNGHTYPQHLLEIEES